MPRKSNGGCVSSSSGNGGGSSSWPISSSAAKPSAASSVEDDLPEELKRSGKDLVEKIGNESMERWDSISFHAIAVLADRKQAVQEVVCWPMKRQDLLTGLRRAPHFCLLYIQPGTGKRKKFIIYFQDLLVRTGSILTNYPAAFSILRNSDRKIHCTWIWGNFIFQFQIVYDE